MKIGVLLPNWIGDVVMATPALRALRNHFGPQAEITGVMRPYVSEVLSGTHWLDRAMYLDRRSSDRQLRLFSVAKQLRALKLDLLLLMTNSPAASLLSWLSGAPRRVGFVRQPLARCLLTDRLYPPRNRTTWVPYSALDSYLELTCHVGCPTVSKQLELGTLPADEQAASQLWRTLKLNQSPRTVVLNPGGAYGVAKHWPAEHFAQLAVRVVNELDAGVLVLCGPKERDIARRIEQQAAHPRVRSLADAELSIGLSKACVRRASLMVSTDSGPRHFASAFGTPLVSLFGAMDPRWSETYNPRETLLMNRLDCAPCGKRECPLGHHRCMRELEVARVWQAVRQHFENQPAQAPAA